LNNYLFLRPLLKSGNIPIRFVVVWCNCTIPCND